MTTDTDQATSPGFGRNSQITALTDFLTQRLEPLVDQSIEIAKSNGYAPFTTTIRAAWVEAIVSVTDSLAQYLAQSTDLPAGPIATLNYAQDPRFSRMRMIARQHRALGITLQMYLGLFKHFRNLYLLELSQMPGGVSAQEMDRVRDYFDEVELSVSADWNDKSDNLRLRELQERSRAITLEKDRYFAIFESLQNAAFLLDRDGRLVNANQASAELFLGRDAQAGEIIYLRSMRREKKKLQSVVDQVMALGQSSDGPVWLDTLGGSRCFDILMRTLHDSVENTAIGHVVLLNDVTDLQRKAEQARQSEQGMSRFLATMSHEIRTPLHGVLGAAELLRTADRTGASTYLDIIEGAGKSLLQTLSNVLDYSKFENEPPVPRPTETDLQEEIRVFRDIATVGQNVTQSPLEVKIDANVPKSVRIDWGMTQQVLSNLVSNAQKADDGQGVIVALRCAIDETGGNLLHCEVTDHGPGIPPAAAAALQSSFQKAIARDTGNGGSGLGLAISRYLVEAMKGQISYENRPDGTCVSFQIPLMQARSRSTDDPNVAKQSDDTGPEVRFCLLIDDDPIGALVTSRQLDRIGLVVTRAASVREALEVAGHAEFDVFVVDYLLPDGDGPSLVKELKRQTGTAARFLALTANVDGLAGQKAEFDEVLAKPAGQMTLASAIFGSRSRAYATLSTTQEEFEGLQGLAQETVAAMIAAFEVSWSNFREMLVGSGSGTSREALALAAHRHAGSCAVLGLTELEPLLRRLEEAYNTDAVASLTSFLPALDKDLDQIPSWRRLKSAWEAE
ncbi:ATP-binding protein [Ruegeria sp. 2205SS24-7]|uniref:ATP-binding protein n=1 Tax=Ruegeria discodermiae TaxID=3064389 RepID=UPI00274273F5|nr:ATP-binding protein [Ruegeria sp. 2205SS24-7]MDP5220200.1 ATP-binding protein [Ruegeria sp. 2205SS24-7]